DVEHRQVGDRAPQLRAVAPLPADVDPIELHVRRVNVASLARTTACLAALSASALILSGIALWWAAGQAGLLGSAESAMASTLGLESWSLPSATLLAGWVGVVVLTTLLVVVVVTLLAVAFNRIGAGIGGVKVVATPERAVPTS
ncbi:MAG: DUF3566 domain-containing protein, partial [Acidimicrobiales bacterium]